jgi:hypothetical protein
MIALLVACVDLPAGWEDAEPIADFTQTECAGDAYDTGVTPEVAATAATDGVDVAATQVAFRCAQDVEGFWRASGDAADVLLQPVDMNPTSVAKCDCLYDFAMLVPTDASNVTVYSRGDHKSGRDDEPAEVGSADVE